MSNMSNDNETAGESEELRIVVGVDGSEYAFRALDFAAHEAALRGALLHVVSAYEIPSSLEWMAIPLRHFEESASANQRVALARVHELNPSVVTKGELYHGFAGDILVDAGDGATMIVLGSLGREEVAGLLIGAVSNHCIRHAICPVTIVH
jgi:nucleotide-binding universal stress UspA family protein